MTTQRKPMAFYHQDGHIPAWNFAKRYAGAEGRIATLPEIIEARLATLPNELPWRRYFTSNTAEYFGKGADGREKLIVAHGVGPMSTIEGIKAAYSWEYKDKDRHRRGGRISSEEFLKLEAGKYGATAVLTSVKQFMELNSAKRYSVFVIDFEMYMQWAGEDAFNARHTAVMSAFDLLLLARLGTAAHLYIEKHLKNALDWHRQESIKFNEKLGPYIIFNEGASNCPYLTYQKVNGRVDWSKPLPWPLEKDRAIGHLISIDGLSHTSSMDDYGTWEGLVCHVSCHEWWNGVRFLSVPEHTDWTHGIDEAPQPDEILRRQWQRLMRPFSSSDYTPPRLYRLESANGEWFTRYAKQPDGERMDEGDIEFHVRSARQLDGPATFKVDELFFLRYDLSTVVALAPSDANAYDIIDISRRDKKGLTTVTVQFYDADVDTSQRLPRVKEIKQDYDLLMG